MVIKIPYMAMKRNKRDVVTTAAAVQFRAL
jgi:hypothetical protein